MKIFGFCTVLLLELAGLSWAGKDKPPMQKTYDASADNVYAAMVQAVGSTFKSAVKEACTVNFRGKSVTNFSTGSFAGNAVCRSTNDRRILVTLSVQTVGEGSMFRGPAQERFVSLFWTNLETALNKAPAAVEGPLSTPENEATLSVSSTPDGADITVDGKFFGSTPATLRLSAGEHIVRVSNVGFQPWERTVTVTSGGAASIKALLEAAK